MAPTTSPWLNTPSSLPAGCPWNPVPPKRSPDWPLPVPDLRSTSTVTESASSSENDNLFHDDHSSTSSPTHFHLPRSSIRWTADEFDADEDLLAPISSRLSNQPPSVRTLPRCAVLNFRKEGDSLRWAARVTQNCGGVAARAHNFEDAFSLEEFSSRALPMIWQSTGGNPRLSSGIDGARHSASSCESDNLGKGGGNQPKLVDQSASEKNFAERSFRSGFGSQRSISKNPSFKRSMVMATEMRRPSFWSRLAQNNKYRGKAHSRLQADEKGKGQSGGRGDGATRGFKKSTWNAVVKAVTRRNGADEDTDEARKGGRKGGRKGSLLRRLVDRKHGKEDAGHEEGSEAGRVEDRVRALKLGDERGGAIRMRRKNGVGRPSMDSTRDGFLPGRRVRSSLGGSVRAKGEAVSPGSQDDQYVTFITSEM